MDSSPPLPDRSAPRGLRPNRSRSYLVLATMTFAASVAAARGLLYVYMLDVWNTAEDWTEIDQLEQSLHTAELASVLFAGIPFLFWFRRAYGNAITLGHRAMFRPGWATGAWFVPLLNFVRPFQIASAMWRHAGPRVGAASLVGYWWTFWIARGVLGRAGTLMSGGSNTDDTKFGVQLLLVSYLSALLAAVLAMVIVRRLTRAHEEMIPENAADVFA